MAKALFTNKTLRKLELEGNCLGLQSAKAFAVALRKNTTLRYLDLESNNLAHEGEDNGGVEDMIQALAHNKSLLSLNLANNRLDENLGRMFLDLFNPRRYNQETLIDFEFGFNSFRLEDVSFTTVSSRLITALTARALNSWLAPTEQSEPLTSLTAIDTPNSGLLAKEQGQVRLGETRGVARKKDDGFGRPATEQVLSGEGDPERAATHGGRDQVDARA